MYLIKKFVPQYFRIGAILGTQGVFLCHNHVQKKDYSIQPVQMDFVLYDSPDTNHNLPPIIIMHGLFGSKQNWRGISKALEAKLKRRIYAVDARNHGDSPHTTDHSSSEMAADVVQFMKDRGEAKACVMGHSMGGRSMMFMAMKYPDLVDRGIIVDISPLDIPRDFSHMEEILFAMKNIKVSPEMSMADGRKQVESQIAEAVGSKETVNFIMMNLRKRDNGEFYWAVNVDSLLKNLGYLRDFPTQIKSLPNYQGPMMFLCGKQSNFVNPNSFPAIQKIFPNSEIHWLDAGHLVHFDQPAQFIDLVVKFVNALIKHNLSSLKFEKLTMMKADNRHDGVQHFQDLFGTREETVYFSHYLALFQRSSSKKT